MATILNPGPWRNTASILTTSPGFFRTTQAGCGCTTATGNSFSCTLKPVKFAGHKNGLVVISLLIPLLSAGNLQRIFHWPIRRGACILSPATPIWNTHIIRGMVFANGPGRQDWNGKSTRLPEAQMLCFTTRHNDLSGNCAPRAGR